ncbi:MAG: glycosyltransferase [bacterium]|nr:glycosyltransferase [bacterium]
MRIAIVLDSVTRAGAERQALYTVRELARRGHDVELIYYRRTQYEYDVSDLGGAKVTFLSRHGSYPRFLLRMYRHLKRGGFDVVHGFKATPSIYGGLAAWLAGVPVVLGGYRSGGYQGRGVVRLLHRLSVHVFTGWVVNAQAIADAMVAGIKLPPERCWVVYNGIEPDAFVSALSPAESKRRLGLDEGAPVVSLVARFDPPKNHALFLRMAGLVHQSFPEARFLLVGDGELRDPIRRQAESMGLGDCVRFLGHREDVPDVLAATDISVITSHYEGLSNVLVEAMAASRPVVSTAYPGAEELVTDGHNGWLAPCGDAPAFADCVRRLLEDPSLRQQMGENGRRIVEERFSIDASMDRLVSVYEECLHRIRPPDARAK